MKIVNTRQMRCIENRSREAGVGDSALMENAGLAVAEYVRNHLGEVRGVSIIVLIGPGNNGGDGLVTALHLRKWGGIVTTYVCQANRDKDPKIAILEKMGVRMLFASRDKEFAGLRCTLMSTQIVIDAILGTGRSRSITGVLRNVLIELSFARERRSGLQVVALDVPTGLDANTGLVDPLCPVVDVTVALGYPKVGLYELPGAKHAGHVRVVDIGVPPGLADDINIDLMTPEFAHAILPSRPLYAHKGTFGRALVVAGSSNYVGAAYLASSAAFRSGAGLVTLAIPRSLQMAVASKVLEPTYIPLPESSPGVLSDDAHKLILENLSGYDALLVGCGLGQAPATQRMLERILLSGITLPPVVVDADGLNFLSGYQSPGWWERMRIQGIVTPHSGEMARLTLNSVDLIQTDRIGGSIDAAVKWGKVVVLKGAHTVVAYPDGRAMLSPFVNPGMATAGTGDVLSGIIVGLLAQKLSLGNAAALGVYLHGMSGEWLRDELGETGMIASDLLGPLPRIIKKLVLETNEQVSNQIDHD